LSVILVTSELEVAQRVGIDPRDLFFELGRRQAVAGQEDVVPDVAKYVPTGRLGRHAATHRWRT
jgi:4-hydroxy 2-oxovalerate aldolase